MPDAGTIAQMYGPSYAQDVAAADSADPKNPRAVVDYLRSRAPGVFVDYGCGDGRLLVAARDLGWNAVGVELSPEVARTTEQRTGARVRTPEAPELPGIADVLHLGDVIEHLTDMDRQLGHALSVLKAGGILIAQGPLENNPNLFTAIVRVARRFRKAITNMAPYHVMLATSEGQLALFARMNLESLAYTITEEAWPAPARFFSGGRGMALYTLRRVSQAISAVVPAMGNRYFYIGRLRA
jgi:SAM-dependent methyltransferase